jgi:glycosyltransferase involved in cell wall biosynthesis
MISFVVPAYNEEAFIADTLNAIHFSARVVGEQYEIVVADDE